MADSHRSFGYWATITVAVLMAIFGLPILIGGVWLIILGGSWYYAAAGLGLLSSAYFLFRHSITGVWIYLATFFGTLVWALWEAGLDGWAQVPRLIAPTVILVLVLATIPALRGRFGLSRGGFAATAVGALAVGASVMVLTSVRDQSSFAQEAVPPAPQAPEPLFPAPKLRMRLNHSHRHRQCRIRRRPLRRSHLRHQ